MKHAGKLLDIRLLDHLIITKERYCSFAEKVITSG
ncbi:JAB domain-containing protein [Parapedobacter tibetensis]